MTNINNLPTKSVIWSRTGKAIMWAFKELEVLQAEMAEKQGSLEEGIQVSSSDD